jgi:D-glycero-alpha-D-manno-heptose-7-phosphate kinase
MIISRTPFRISFFGGGTDFPEFYREHRGAVLATTIDQYCYLSIHRLSPFFKHRFRASYSKTETVQKPEEFQHPLIRECLLVSGIREGLEISHVSDLPGRTGLGTSSAFTVGLLNALHALKGDSITSEDLAREAILVERDRVGDAGGHQDQYVAAYGGLLRLDFSGSQNVQVKKLAVTGERIRQLESHLVLFYLGVERSEEELLEVQKQRTLQNVPTLLEMLKLVDEAEAIVSGSGRLDEVGRLLHATWELKKELSRGITNSMIDDAYAVARSAGALGGKLLGAGGRGFLLLYAMPERHPRLREQLARLQPVSFRFSSSGSEIIFRSCS